MIPRKGLEDLLEARLGNVVGREKLADLMKEVDKLDDQWEELDVPHREMGYSLSVNCPDICYLASQVYEGAVIKLFRKKTSTAH